jgi:hypothetical protein
MRFERRGVVGVAEPRGDPPPLLVDGGEAFPAHPVHVLRVERDRDEPHDLGRVPFLAVGEGAEAD